MNNLSKWWMTMKISWIKYTAYRLNFFLQIIGPSLGFFFLKFNLWISIFETTPDIKLIGSYNLSQMLQYHTWSLIVALVAQGHASWNLSEDIRMGKISSYLIYPFNFWEFHTASWLSFQVIQTIVAVITLLFINSLGIIPSFILSGILKGFAFTLFVSLFWYILQYLTGIMSFWLEETWILRVMLQVITTFLSGSILPLEFYPDWLVKILNYTPFPYLTYYPVKIFMGAEVDIFRGLAILTFWGVLISFLNSFIWRRGIRLYTAAGM
jgi:ABC-2 type transport system permease protein